MSILVNIRIAEQQDANSLILFNQAMAKETEGKELPDETITPGVNALIQNTNLGFYVVAEVNKVVVGSLMITSEWSDWRNGLFWWVQSVYILPEYRRKGIYKKLYDFVKTRAESEKNVCGFRLYVEKDNLVAQKTYEALGMKQSDYLMYEESY